MKINYKMDIEETIIVPKGIVIVPIRDLSHKDAKNEISDFIQSVGNRKVYISEFAEKLRLDDELIEKIIKELNFS